MKKMNLTVSTLGVLKVLVTVSTLGGCGGLERTEFQL